MYLSEFWLFLILGSWSITASIMLFISLRVEPYTRKNFKCNRCKDTGTIWAGWSGMEVYDCDCEMEKNNSGMDEVVKILNKEL